MPHDHHVPPLDLGVDRTAAPEPRVVLPEAPPGGVTAGIDWATTDHAVAVVDATGSAIDQYTIPAAAAGLRELVRRLRRADVAEVAIERSDGVVVDTLLAAGFTVVVIDRGRWRTCAAAIGPPGTRTTGSTPTSWPTRCAPTGPGCVR
jgi:hypothetical protein